MLHCMKARALTEGSHEKAAKDRGVSKRDIYQSLL